MGDIEKALFLWVDDIDEAEPKVITVRFTRHVFGLS